MWMWDEGTDGCLDTRGGLPVYANPSSRSMGVRAAGSRARPCASARSFGLFFIDGISGTHAASTRTFLAYTNGYYCLELLVSVVQWPFPTHRSAFSIIYVGDRRSPPHSLRYPSLPFICYALCTYAVVERQLPNYSPSPSPLRLRSCLESELYYYCYPYVSACKPTLCC